MERMWVVLWVGKRSMGGGRVCPCIGYLGKRLRKATPPIGGRKKKTRMGDSERKGWVGGKTTTYPNQGKDRRDTPIYIENNQLDRGGEEAS